MAKIPGQRKSGSFGGDGHRSNRSAFRRSGGSVKPPKKGCALVGLAMIGSPVLAAVATAYYHLAT